MMKNGIYFIVIALLVAKLFKILIYATFCGNKVKTQVKLENMEYLCKY